MSRGLNKVTLIGHLGKDPVLKTTESGSNVCNFSLATSEKYKSGDEWVDKTEWHNVVAWNKTAENCGSYLQKGSKVFIDGKLQTRSWEKDGTKHYITEIVARDVIFLDSREDRTSEPVAEQQSNSDDDIPF